MPDLIIRPYEGAGRINFDMNPDEVAAELGDPSSKGSLVGRFRMSYDGPPDLRVDFDGNSRCEFIHVEQRSTDPGAPTAVVAGIRLTGTYEEIVSSLVERHSIRRPQTADGQSNVTLCDELGVGVGFPTADLGVAGIDPGQVIFAFAYRRGYWNGHFVEDQ